MFYTLLFIFTTFSCESETSLVKGNKTDETLKSKIISQETLKIFFPVDTSNIRNKVESIVQEYMDKVNQLSKQYPNHEIELQIEYSPVPTKPTSVNPVILRRASMLVPRLFQLKKMTSPSSTISTTTTSTPPLSTTTTTTSTTELSSPPTKKTHLREEQESEKVPIYMDDLKKALDDFEKKLEKHSNCNHENTANGNIGQKDYSSHPTITPPRNIQDILQLIGKGVKVEYNAPIPTDDGLEWLQIKIPTNLQALQRGFIPDVAVVDIPEGDDRSDVETEDDSWAEDVEDSSTSPDEDMPSQHVDPDTDEPQPEPSKRAELI